MILKKSIIAVGLMGLMFGGEVAIAASICITAIYCAKFIFCRDPSNCEMPGEMGKLMSAQVKNVYKNNTFLFWEEAFYKGGGGNPSGCNYGGRDFPESSVAFFSNPRVNLYPIYNNSRWMASGMEANCAADFRNANNATECPFTTEAPSSLRLRR